MSSSSCQITGLRLSATCGKSHVGEDTIEHGSYQPFAIHAIRFDDLPGSGHIPVHFETNVAALGQRKIAFVKPARIVRSRKAHLDRFISQRFQEKDWRDRKST